MKEKRIALWIAIALSLLVLTGCGDDFPQLTEQEMDDVGDYAARLLLKYDADYRSRLVDLSEVEEREQKEQRRLEEQRARQEEETVEEGGMDPVDDTPVRNNGQSITGESDMASSVASMEEFWELPAGISITYSNYEVSDSIGDAFFSMDASEGKRLLLVYFLVNNQTDTEQVVDILSSSTNFKITVNDSYTRTALTTMLLNDMATYRGTIPAQGAENLLLAVEIDAGMEYEITTAALTLKNDENTYTMRLF